MTQDRAAALERVYGDLRHHISPAIGWVRLADAGNDADQVTQAMAGLDERFRRAAEAVLPAARAVDEQEAVAAMEAAGLSRQDAHVAATVAVRLAGA